jgi:hypothetical protein
LPSGSFNQTDGKAILRIVTEGRDRRPANDNCASPGKHLQADKRKSPGISASIPNAFHL